MADVYRDWVLYNVWKAIKNWTEYPFDWTMLNEYNQLVTYYDTAQQQIRTSIINKWVYVPANATINTYPWYIDQIQQEGGTGAGALASWLKLYPCQLYNSTYNWVNVWGFYSWTDWTTYYWLNAFSTYGSAHDENCFWICTYKKDVNSDISYWVSFSDFSIAAGTTIDNTYFYSKWNEIRCYIVTSSDHYPREYGVYAWRGYTWNFSTDTTTMSQWQSNSSDPVDWWEDLTWRTAVSWSSWVQSVTWGYYDHYWYLYLTLNYIPSCSWNEWIFEPTSLVITNAIRNDDDDPVVTANLWDIINSGDSTYYRYFWLMDTSTTAYGEYHLCVFKKTPWADPTFTESSWIGEDRFWFYPVDWRMKVVGNDVIFSALWYEFTNSTPSAKDHYYCWNAVNNVIWQKVDCWISDDIWIEQVYANWTNSCWITAEESIAAINKVTISTSDAWWWGSIWFNIVWTINS
jgi:hypothetical protein